MKTIAIRVWSDDYISGFEKIDEQHKSLFHLVNTFEEENGKDTSPSIIAHFAEKIISFSDEHFELENELMETSNYPLMDYHKRIHDEYLEDMKRVFDLKTSEPYFYVIDVAAKWLHHVVMDDLTLFYHCKHLDYAVDIDIIGRICEIYSLDNKLLGYGKNSFFSKEEIIITCNSGFVSLATDSIVKISVSGDNHEWHYFVARVDSMKDLTLKLRRTALIKTVNDRQYYRIPFEADARLLFDKKSSSMKIMDISGGGMLIETDEVLEIGKDVMVEFTLIDTSFTEKSEVVRSFKKDVTAHNYGMKYIELDASAHNDLMKNMLLLQSKRNRLQRA